jgi:hypothetical protein
MAGIRFLAGMDVPMFNQIMPFFENSGADLTRMNSFDSLLQILMMHIRFRFQH